MWGNGWRPDRSPVEGAGVRGLRSRRAIATSAFVLGGVLIGSGAGLADAGEGNTCTGCLSRWDVIFRVAIGDETTRPCHWRSAEISWNEYGGGSGVPGPRANRAHRVRPDLPDLPGPRARKVNQDPRARPVLPVRPDPVARRATRAPRVISESRVSRARRAIKASGATPDPKDPRVRPESPTSTGRDLGVDHRRPRTDRALHVQRR
jgi:hypothetical protein